MAFKMLNGRIPICIREALKLLDSALLRRRISWRHGRVSFRLSLLSSCLSSQFLSEKV